MLTRKVHIYVYISHRKYSRCLPNSQKTYFGNWGVVVVTPFRNPMVKGPKHTNLDGNRNLFHVYDYQLSTVVDNHIL